MKQISISTRLFGITALFFILFITAIMVLHTTFFESYYQQQKTSDLLAGLTQLKEDITAHPTNVKELIQHFENKYNAEVAVTISTSGPNRYRDVKVAAPTLLQSPALGWPREELESELFPQNLQGTDLIWIATRVAQEYGFHNIRYQQLEEQAPAILYANSRDEEWLSNQILAITELSSNQDSVNYAELLNTLFPMEGDNDMGSLSLSESESLVQRPMLMALASLQPVGEAATIFKDLYLYIYIMAILVILLMTFIFSRMITRPLIRLNEVASRMAKLDFTAKYEVKSGDEIGSLGHTLNFLSNNLRDNIGKLHAANEQLKRDIELEKQLERQRKEFVAGVSHELKTPLSVISGYAEGLRDGIVQDYRRNEYLDVILAESENMSRLVTDMLDLSQLESGRYVLNLMTFNILELTRLVMDRIELLTADKQVEWSLNASEMEEVEVLGDPHRIEQVLKNLLTNAVRHTEQQGQITIRLVDVSLTEVEVQITNSGEPIPDDALPYIWDSFYRVDPSRSRDASFFGTGTGIGLAIVKNILILHHSRFHVLNSSDGVTFTFTLRKMT